LGVSSLGGVEEMTCILPSQFVEPLPAIAPTGSLAGKTVFITYVCKSGVHRHSVVAKRWPLSSLAGVRVAALR
jgi:hypothetical protein